MPLWCSVSCSLPDALFLGSKPALVRAGAPVWGHLCYRNAATGASSTSGSRLEDFWKDVPACEAPRAGQGQRDRAQGWKKGARGKNLQQEMGPCAVECWSQRARHSELKERLPPLTAGNYIPEDINSSIVTAAIVTIRSVATCDLVVESLCSLRLFV